MFCSIRFVFAVAPNSGLFVFGRIMCPGQIQIFESYPSESQNTDAQGTRAPTTTLYVLCGLQEGVRLYLP